MLLAPTFLGSESDINGDHVQSEFERILDTNPDTHALLKLLGLMS